MSFPGSNYNQNYAPPPPTNYYHPVQGNAGYNSNYNNYNGIPQGPPPNWSTRPQYGNHGSAPNMGSNAYHYNQGFAAPPTAPQGFSHNVNNYNFQYSNCTGKRKALLIGINYFGSRSELKGCINDVHNMTQFLIERYGFHMDDMVILTDDQANPRAQPTRMNMIQAIQWLVKDARPNDSLFFHYSGHGSRVADLDGDEDDGYDETIVPVDFQQAGEIVDDELHWRMVMPLPPGCRLTAIFDSCHSGSALDLPYLYSTQGLLKEPNLMKEAGSGILSAGMSYMRGDLGGVFSAASGIFKKVKNSNSGAAEQTKRTKTSPADVISFSGCKDSQTSADTRIAGSATGAMSFGFRNALLKNPQQSFVMLLNSVRDELASYSQKPQLSSSHPIDTNYRKILFLFNRSANPEQFLSYEGMLQSIRAPFGGYF